jgi:hypothetical protein
MSDEVELCGVKFDLSRFNLGKMQLFVDTTPAHGPFRRITSLRVLLKTKDHETGEPTNVGITHSFDMSMVEHVRERREFVARAVRNALAEVLVQELESALFIDGVPMKETKK